jgi:uncharacterized membrane protein HdeD (DUF308 family)
MSEITDVSPAGGPNVKLLGIITIILGILAISAPLITGLSIALLVGVLVLAGGVTRIVWALRAGSFGKGLLRFAIGALTVICGIVLVTDPLVASGILTILLAVYFVLDGVAEIVGAFHVRPVSGWGWLLVGGIISLLLGVMIWRQFPLSGAWAIGVLLGFRLLLVGISMVIVAPVVRSNT